MTAPLCVCGHPQTAHHEGRGPCLDLACLLLACSRYRPAPRTQ